MRGQSAWPVSPDHPAWMTARCRPLCLPVVDRSLGEGWHVCGPSRRESPEAPPLARPESSRVTLVSPATSHLDRLSVRPSFAAPGPPAGVEVLRHPVCLAPHRHVVQRPTTTDDCSDASRSCGRPGRSRAVRAGPPAAPPPVTAAKTPRTADRCLRCTTPTRMAAARVCARSTVLE